MGNFYNWYGREDRMVNHSICIGTSGIGILLMSNRDAIDRYVG